MTTPPTIEPMTEAHALSGGTPPPEPPPGFIPYPPRPSWWQRHPGVAVTLVVALAAGAGQLGEGVYDLLLDKEHAERQLLIDAGDQREAEARTKGEATLRKSIRENGKAIAKNGAAINSMATYSMESDRHMRDLIRELADRDARTLEKPGPLREAEAALRKLRTPR